MEAGARCTEERDLRIVCALRCTVPMAYAYAVGTVRHLVQQLCFVIRSFASLCPSSVTRTCPTGRYNFHSKRMYFRAVEIVSLLVGCTWHLSVLHYMANHLDLYFLLALHQNELSNVILSKVQRNQSIWYCFILYVRHFPFPAMCGSCLPKLSVSVCKQISRWTYKV